MRFPKQFVTGGALARARDLTGGDLRVLLALIVTAGDDAVATATQSELSGMTGLGRRFVRDRLEHLHEAGYIEAQSGRGKTASYTLKLAGPPAIQMAPIQDNSTEPELAGPPAISALKLAGGPAISLEAPTRVLNSPTGTSHPHEPNARSALQTLITDRNLELTLDELLTNAYRLGTGDPWEGYLVIKATTEDALGPDVKNRAAVTRWRLRKATPRRNIPKNDEWMYRAGTPTRTDIPKGQEWMYT